ncbi:MAG: energy transducer TonB [Gemmatimonadales bacterium]
MNSKGRVAIPSFVILTLLLAPACNRASPDTVRLPDETPARRGDDAPVMINPESPVEYPPALYTRGIEGNVLLRLHVDSAGNVAPDSTGLAESSGYPALDTAALEAVGQFHFAPALRGGMPVAATFLQPIHFRHSQVGGTTP